MVFRVKSANFLRVRAYDCRLGYKIRFSGSSSV